MFDNNICPKKAKKNPKLIQKLEEKKNKPDKSKNCYKWSKNPKI